MKVLTHAQLGEDPRLAMQGARWLLLTKEEMEQSTTTLMFTELEDVLVGVDHRGSVPDGGWWQRTVHLILIDGTQEDGEAFRKQSGITKVIAGSNLNIQDYLW
tara:strand:- start:5157 stop:5465 length:309 start_codon:yes stop_codon:yes gene_type:complete